MSKEINMRERERKLTESEEDDIEGWATAGWTGGTSEAP